jgi:hypothetical protein
LLFETDKRFGEDQKTLDISQYSLELSLVMSTNYSFFHKSFRLLLVILNLRAFSSKSSYFIFNSIHVDDIYLFSSDINYVHEFNQKLEQKFKIMVDMEADKYLGILLSRMDDGSIKMQQPKLLTALFDEFADELSKTKKKKVTAPTSQSLINIKSTTSTSISKHNDNFFGQQQDSI